MNPPSRTPKSAHWIAIATSFLCQARANAGGGSSLGFATATGMEMRLCAFFFHQAVEFFLNAVIASGNPSEAERRAAQARAGLPNRFQATHSLAYLRELAGSVCPAVQGALPRESAEDERLFKLLARSYADSRYRRSFALDPEDAARLRVMVETLERVVQEHCTAIKTEAETKRAA